MSESTLDVVDYTPGADVIYVWQNRNWRYEICDNPNGPYLRETWLGNGRPVHPAVDPTVSEILNLCAEIDGLLRANPRTETVQRKTVIG